MINLRDYKNDVYQIIGAAMAVHSELHKGLLEPIYQEALSWELEQRGISHKREAMLRIFYKEHELDKKYKIDFLVDDIIVEVKSVSKLLPEHRSQLCNYLRIANKPIGLLINFGENDLIGERWAYDNEDNECFLVDKDMQPLYNKNYDNLIY